MIIGTRFDMKFSVSVTVGYDLRTVNLTEKQWKAVQDGKPLVKRVKDHYEGQAFTYVFHFNMDPANSLMVTYDDADGYLGDIADAMVSEVE
jgi:hypothetical protein